MPEYLVLGGQWLRKRRMPDAEQPGEIQNLCGAKSHPAKRRLCRYDSVNQDSPPVIENSEAYHARKAKKRFDQHI